MKIHKRIYKRALPSIFYQNGEGFFCLKPFYQNRRRKIVLKINELSQQHQFVWNTLQLLEDGERILGPDLQARAAIPDRRTLYHIINDLRKYGYLVGSSKTSGSGGYFEIRDEQDLNKTLNDLRNSAFSLLSTAKTVELSFYKQELDEDGEEAQ